METGDRHSEKGWEMRDGACERIRRELRQTGQNKKMKQR